MSYRLEGDEQERKLFVAGINKATVDEDVLKNYFEQYGSIIDCTVMRDQDRQSRGFGFVLFDDASSVDNIIAAKKDGTEFSIDGHHVEVKRALPKTGGNVQTSRTTGLNRKIFVGGLPSSITEEELRQYFQLFGHVSEVELLRDRVTERLRGFAFITFEDEDSADKCIQRRSHEICKKICEVKRAQTRSTLGASRRSDGFDNRDSRQGPPYGGAATHGSMSVSDVNQLIQQAFLMGQQSSQSATGAQPNSTVLLQALLNQQAPAPAPVAPVPAPVAPAAPANTAALAQLAQLLQGGGINTNALGALLKGETQQAATAPVVENASTGYTSYDYNYSNKASSYGPTKDDGKRSYNPY